MASRSLLGATVKYLLSSKLFDLIFMGTLLFAPPIVAVYAGMLVAGNAVWGIKSNYKDWQFYVRMTSYALIMLGLVAISPTVMIGGIIPVSSLLLGIGVAGFASILLEPVVKGLLSYVAHGGQNFYQNQQQAPTFVEGPINQPQPQPAPQPAPPQPLNLLQHPHQQQQNGGNQPFQL